MQQCAIGTGGDKVALWSHPQELKAAYATETGPLEAYLLGLTQP